MKKVKRKLIHVPVAPPIQHLLKALGEIWGFKTRNKTMEALILGAAVVVSSLPKDKGLTKKQMASRRYIKQVIRELKENVVLRQAVLSMKIPESLLKEKKK